MAGVADRPRGVLRTVALAVLAVAPAGLAIAVFAAADVDARLAVLAPLLYWSMFPLVALALVTLVRRVRHRARSTNAARSSLLVGAVLAAMLTGAVLSLVPPRLRMQFDETSLVGTSQSMHEQRAALLTTGAVPFHGRLVRLENAVDKRPPLFPFLASLVHDVTGMRIANAFVVNAVLLATALLLAFAAARAGVRREGGAVAAIAAPFLLLAVALTGVTATSAGFELLAGVLLFAVLFAAVDFVRAPDPVRWSALLGLGLLLAASRYESLFAGALVLALAAWLARGRWRMDRVAFWTTVAAPALLMPIGMLLVHARDPNFYPEAGGRPTLHWSYLGEHTLRFLAMLSTDLRGTMPGPLTALAAVAWIERAVRRRTTRLDLLVGIPVLAITVLVLAWFYSDVRELGSHRLFLPSCWFVALSPLLLVRGPRSAWALMVLAVALAALRVHDLRSGRAFPNHETAVLTTALDRIVPQLAVEPRTTLWVGTPALHLIVNGHAALCPGSFARRLRDIQQLAAQGDVRAIFVLETPIDGVHAGGLGDPRAVLPLRPHELLLRDEASGVAVYRLRP